MSLHVLVILPPTYSCVGEFHEGLASVSIKMYDNEGNVPVYKWGFISKKGEMLINPQFEEVEDFRNGLAKVWIGDSKKRDSKFGYIDRAGKYIWEPSN